MRKGNRRIRLRITDVSDANDDKERISLDPQDRKGSTTGYIGISAGTAAASHAAGDHELYEERGEEKRKKERPAILRYAFRNNTIVVKPEVGPVI